MRNLVLNNLLKLQLSLRHISEPTRRYAISYAVFCLKKKNSDSDVTFCYILKKFIGNMRNLVLNNLLKLQIAGPNHILL